MASILFEIKIQGTKGYNDIGLKKPSNTVFDTLKQFRVTKLYLLTLASNSYIEIYEYDKSLITSQKKIVLYSSELGYYIDASSSSKVLDFDEAYSLAADVSDDFKSKNNNMKSTGNVAIRYGPVSTAEIKHYAPKGSVFNFSKEYNGWYFTTSPSPGWMQLILVSGKLEPINIGSEYRSSVNGGQFENSATNTINVFSNKEKTYVNSNTPITLLTPTSPIVEFTGLRDPETGWKQGSPSPNILINNSVPYDLRNIVNSPGPRGEQISKLIKAAGIYDRADIEWYDKFNRFGCIDPYNNVTTTKEYLFFTKPDLHLFDKGSTQLNPELANIPIFVDAHKRYYPVFKELQWSADTTNPFMNILSNSVQSTLDLPGISAEDITTSQNIYGTSISYRRGSYQSDEGHEFSLEFEDTKYLEIYMLFKLFDEYERRKTWGDITPPDGHYRYRKILHDQFSIYKFIVGEDGMQLLYWAKLTGVYPKSVPRDAFSDMSSSGGLRFPIQFKAQFVEDMDPRILVDFNQLIYPNMNRPDLPLFDKRNSAPESEWALCPYIVSNDARRPERQINTGFNYYMLWKKA